MAVPKKKPAKPQTRKRFRAWVRKVKTKLLKKTHLVTCDHCGEKKLSHRVCPGCNHYNGKDFSKEKVNLGKDTTTIEI